MANMKRISTFALIVSVCLLATACVIVPIDPEAGDGAAGSAVLQARDVESYLEDYWEPYLLPEIYERRVDLVTLFREADASGWEHVGETYGEIRGVGASYNFIVYGTAVVRETNTESRNGFIVVEFEGLNSYEIQIAIGPALTGSAIRDSLRFVDFNQFVNQVDFANLARELNRLGNENAQENIDLFSLDGKSIEFTGAFTEPGAGNVISIMPIFMEVR